MNYNQHFDKHIKEQFEDYKPQVHPRIWENIMKEREKKRPVGFWRSFFNQRTILLVAGILLVTGVSSYFLFKKQADVAETAVTTSSSSPSDNNITTDENKIASIENINSEKDKPSEIVNTAPVATNSQNNSEPAIANNTYSGLSSRAARDNNISGKRQTTSGHTKTHIPAGKQKVKTSRGSKVFANNDIDDYIVDTEEDAEYNLSIVAFSPQKNGITKIPLSLQSLKMVKLIDPGCPSIEKDAAGNKTYVEIYGGADYAFRSFSDTGNSVYLQKRKESTKFSSAFSAGLRYTKVFSNGVSIRTGINYSQINEKFIYSEGNIVQVVYIINAAGDTIGSYTTIGSRFKTTYNKFKTIDVPVVLGYEIGNGKLHANINAGVIINAYSWQKGEVLDNNLKPVNITTGKSNSPYQFKTNIGIGFIGSVSFYYKLNEKFHLMAEPYFRYNLTPASKETITFKQKYNTAGLRLGLRLDLR